MVQLKITEKKENKLAGRTEMEGRLAFQGATPSNDVLKEKLAAELNKDKELVVVKHIYSKYSHQEADFLVYIYDSKETMDRMEVSTKHLRKKADGKKKKEEAPAEEKKEEPKTEEAPKEEAKEEQPAEEEKEEPAPKEEDKQ